MDQIQCARELAQLSCGDAMTGLQHLLVMNVENEVFKGKHSLTRAVRGSDYSPAAVLSEEKYK